MNPTEIDQILADEQAVEPSPAFMSRVMQAVQADVAVRRSPIRRGAPLWMEWVALATFALVSVTSANEVREAMEAVPEIGLALATWLSLMLPCTLAIGWWLARPFGHRSAA